MKLIQVKTSNFNAEWITSDRLAARFLKIVGWFILRRKERESDYEI